LVRRVLAILTALLFISAGYNLDLHTFGYAMAGLSVTLALPGLYGSRPA
jgi:hypothetical protein